MFQQHIMKVAISLVIILLLLSGLVLSISVASTHKASAPHLLACGAQVGPPCDTPVQ